MVIHRPDYSQLDRDKNIYFLASGGRDSTAMVLEAYTLGIKGTMIFNDTGLDRNGPPTLMRLQEITKYPLVSLRYDGERPAGEILRESFMHIPESWAKMRETGRYWKNYFYCCKAFKHQPTDRYLDTIFVDEPLLRFLNILPSAFSVLIMGIKGSDGSVTRRLRLAELRNANTFYRLHKNRRLYYYPLRDCSDADVTAILAEYGMTSIPHTGCSLCPVFCLFPGMIKSDAGTWLRSRKYARSLGIKFPECEQTELGEFPEFCSSHHITSARGV